MRALAKGIAHVSFTGGGIVLPARSPYDRQVLIEHVTHRVHTQGRVQVLVDDGRWMVHAHRGAAIGCARCGHVGDSVCYSDATGEVAYCVRCALGDRHGPLPEVHAHVRQAS